MKKTTKKVASETLVNFILDKSGSMSSIQSGTISGFNEYVKTLRGDGNKYAFSLTLFDTEVDKRFVNAPIKDVEDLSENTYSPNGMTALYDAVCSTCNAVEKTVKDDQKVLTVIMTDGQENSSREFKQSDMNDMVKRLEKTGKWTFVFLGANQDSFATGGAVGVSAMNTSNFKASNDGVMRAMCFVAQGTSNFGGGGSGHTANFFSVSDQTNMGGTAAPTGSASVDPQVSAHFSSLGKKSWDKRKKNLQG